MSNPWIANPYSVPANPLNFTAEGNTPSIEASVPQIAAGPMETPKGLDIPMLHDPRSGPVGNQVEDPKSISEYFMNRVQEDPSTNQPKQEVGLPKPEALTSEAASMVKAGVDPVTAQRLSKAATPDAYVGSFLSQESVFVFVDGFDIHKANSPQAKKVAYEYRNRIGMQNSGIEEWCPVYTVKPDEVPSSPLLAAGKPVFRALFKLTPSI